MTNTYIYGGGETIMFSCGEYSDYGVCGMVTVLGPFDMREELEEFKALDRAKPEEERADYYGSPFGVFIGHLITKGLVETHEVEEVHLGSYSELSI